MEIAFYKTHSVIDILPSLQLSKVMYKDKEHYCIMCGWLQWTLDIQF